MSAAARNRQAVGALCKGASGIGEYRSPAVGLVTRGTCPPRLEDGWESDAWSSATPQTWRVPSDARSAPDRSGESRALRSHGRVVIVLGERRRGLWHRLRFPHHGQPLAPADGEGAKARKLTHRALQATQADSRPLCGSKTATCGAASRCDVQLDALAPQLLLQCAGDAGPARHDAPRKDRDPRGKAPPQQPRERGERRSRYARASASEPACASRARLPSSGGRDVFSAAPAVPGARARRLRRVRPQVISQRPRPHRDDRAAPAHPQAARRNRRGDPPALAHSA